MRNIRNTGEAIDVSDQIEERMTWTPEGADSELVLDLEDLFRPM